MMARTARPVLLLEPDDLMRRTVAMVARELRLADVHEASSVAAARTLLRRQRFGAAVLALDAAGTTQDLLQALRDDLFTGQAGIPVAVLAARCGIEQARELQMLGVRRVLLKPFRVNTVIGAIEELAGR
jgi:DNA-binding NarL/FixJ family response regulator